MTTIWSALEGSSERRASCGHGGGERRPAVTQAGSGGPRPAPGGTAGAWARPLGRALPCRPRAHEQGAAARGHLQAGSGGCRPHHGCPSRGEEGRLLRGSAGAIAAAGNGAPPHRTHLLRRLGRALRHRGLSPRGRRRAAPSPQLPRPARPLVSGRSRGGGRRRPEGAIAEGRGWPPGPEEASYMAAVCSALAALDGGGGSAHDEPVSGLMMVSSLVAASPTVVTSAGPGPPRHRAQARTAETKTAAGRTRSRCWSS